MNEALPSFMKIAGHWKVKWTPDPGNGPVVASEDSLFMFTNGFDPNNPGLGGALGNVVERATRTPTCDSWKGFRFAPVAEIRTDVTEHPDWPLKPIKHKQVLVIPFGDVERARMPWWGALSIKIRDVQFVIGVSMFGRAKLRSFLQRGGLDVG
jgi:hypothetical protein